MKTNIVLAASVGLVVGIAADVFFAFATRVPLLGCLFAPVAFVVGLALPVLIGALAALWGRARGLMTTPSAIVDGALAAGLAELLSRVIGFCASLSGFMGPRFILPSVEQSARGVFSGVWALGWLVISVVLAALLGALGGFLYQARR